MIKKVQKRELILNILNKIRMTTQYLFKYYLQFMTIQYLVKYYLPFMTAQYLVKYYLPFMTT